MSDMLEGVLSNGMVTGRVIETHWLPAETLELKPGPGGYVSIFMDGAGVDHMTRVRTTDLLRILMPEIRERMKAEVDRSAGDWFFIDDLLARVFSEVKP